MLLGSDRKSGGTVDLCTATTCRRVGESIGLVFIIYLKETWNEGEPRIVSDRGIFFVKSKTLCVSGNN